MTNPPLMNPLAAATATVLLLFFSCSSYHCSLLAQGFSPTASTAISKTSKHSRSHPPSDWQQHQQRQLPLRPVFTLLQASSSIFNENDGKNNKNMAVVEEEQSFTSTTSSDNNKNDSHANDDDEVNDNVSAFEVVASLTCTCLLESDMRRDAIGKAAGIQASSATNWINDASAFQLQKAFDRLALWLPQDKRNGADRDEAAAWIHWLKATPTPAIVDLSDSFRRVISAILLDRSLELVDQSRVDFLSRMGCRLILLPSGMALDSPLTEPTASLVYGKLLWGGVTRYRLLTSSSSSNSNSRAALPPRRAGLRTETKVRAKDQVPVWLAYGGRSRMYEAVDMGSCAILEIVLLPRGKNEVVSTTTTTARDSSYYYGSNNMKIRNFPWKPQDMFVFQDNQLGKVETTINGDENSQEEEELVGVNGFVATPASLSGPDRNRAFRSDFQTKVGGLNSQIDAIVRRVLDGRVIRPVDKLYTEGYRNNAAGGASAKETDGDDDTFHQLSKVSIEAEELALLGLTPVRGLLLYGPPGCGKTALAREISRALKARAPKIVAAPELLDRWVGGSEKAVRALFADAEAELAVCNGDATKSALHVIVIDEIDAVFRKRSSAEDSGEATRSSVVNQILAKLDGVTAIPNVLLIGMTNRRELLDEALLRPGRLEVQIEIPLPDKEGRREILKIHFDALRRKGRLSYPLCCGIDGVPVRSRSLGMPATSEDLVETNWRDQPTTTITATSSETRLSGRKRAAVLRALNQLRSGMIMRPEYDLAAEYATEGFSGADIAGLVRCAGSIALSRARKDGSGVDGLLITLDDVKQALTEVKR